MTEPLQCFAIAAPGLEPIVARELTTLGEQPQAEDGGVIWEGDARSVMRANLWLRTASRVLVRVARFRATEFFELEKRAKTIEWDRFVGRGVAADFRVTAHKSKLFHSDAIAQRLTSAIAGREPRTENPKQLFVVRVVRDVFEISADTSGDLLHMRGYRQAIAKAPLRETLAAALLLAADWDGATPLVDPFCGSGTIPIEAELIARRMAPGLHRRFAFQDWPGFDVATWNHLLVEARSRALGKAAASIRGSDRDAGAIESSRGNAERAGVSGVEWSVGPLSALAPPSEIGLVATNPPYGKRASKGKDVRNLYAQLGHVLRERCRGWELTLYAADENVAAQIALPLRVLLRTSNGGIRIAALGGKVV